jgi:hypothetical protein
MRFVVLVATLALTATALAGGQNPDSLDAAIRAFHDARSAADLSTASRRVLASGASFDDIAARLRAGRAYTARPTGRVTIRTVVNGTSLDNVVEIPSGYTPAKPWPLRVSLHGGVGREAPGPGDPAPRPLTNRIPGDEEIVVHPRAWSSSEW